MALTTLAIASNRRFSDVFLSGTIATIALDAAINERFNLPAGFGDLVLYIVEANIGTFSGVYVAPAPAYDGFKMGIIDSQATSNIDIIGAERFVSASSSGASLPNLYATVELYRATILRQGEQLQIIAPILAGAGVTGALTCRIRGVREKTD